MFQQFFKPHPALMGLVNNIMIHEVKFDASQSRASFAFPPLPEQSLFFYIRDRMEVEYSSTQIKQTLPCSILDGPHTYGQRITLGQHHSVIKVAFQPGGLYRFLGIPMEELLGIQAFDATEVIGGEIKQVTEQLQEASSYLDMKFIIENYLLQHKGSLKSRLPIDSVLPLMMKEGGLMNIDRLASEACLSIRQFERVFKQRIGLPPKYYSRLVRFAHAWVRKEQCPSMSWIKIAYECGYFDQMHLIRDFKEFAGVNPSNIEAELFKWQVKFNNQIFY
jgi:AraC-like DNA-binding protein